LYSRETILCRFIPFLSKGVYLECLSERLQPRGEKPLVPEAAEVVSVEVQRPPAAERVADLTGTQRGERIPHVDQGLAREPRPRRSVGP
jgi:hypothetical protein